MNAWSNYWQQGHQTTFGDYYKDGYTRGFVHDWWRSCLHDLTTVEQVLEIGCGNGSLIPGLSEAGFNGLYTGVDIALVSPTSDSTPFQKQFIDQMPFEEVPLVDNSIDLIASVFGFEYSNHEASLDKIRALLSHHGDVHLLIHHENSAVTEMSKRAIIEFSTVKIAESITDLERIDHELDRLDGKVELLPSSVLACNARDSVNQYISDVMAQEGDVRNFIAIDFVQKLLGYFKIIRSTSEQRKDYIGSIEPDFRASKERFEQMVSVAMGNADINLLTQKMIDRGFTVQQTTTIMNEGRDTAWYVHLSY